MRDNFRSEFQCADCGHIWHSLDMDTPPRCPICNKTNVLEIQASSTKRYLTGFFGAWIVCALLILILFYSYSTSPGHTQSKTGNTKKISQDNSVEYGIKAHLLNPSVLSHVTYQERIS